MMTANARPDVTQYVNPVIGADCAGLTFVGPTAPFGLVKPGPDCTPAYPAGWRPSQFLVEGFSQTHLSGADDPPKYGNVLLMPFAERPEADDHSALRSAETMRLGYYSCEFRQSGIRTEITAGEKAALYRFTYPEDAEFRGLEVDAGHCLSETETYQHSTNQWVTDAGITLESPHSVSGFTTVAGGWGTALPYTIYFYMETSADCQARISTPNAFNLLFDTDTLGVRIGVSYVSVDKARENAMTVGTDFEKVESDLVATWNDVLSRIEIDPATPEDLKVQFYTGIYHTLIMPTRRTGEWDACGPDEVYYDDYMTLWDTFRTAMPLMTILDPSYITEQVNGLLTIWRHEGIMPDGREGNASVAVQGSTNADIVIADAFFKGIGGIDYEEALKAMLVDAYNDPGNSDLLSGKGRAGLDAFVKYGYVPSDMYRLAGSRTTDYSYCDWLIARVADSLGHKDVADDLYKRAGNWKNLWDADAEFEGNKGFLVPRDSEGVFADSIMYWRTPPSAVSVRKTVEPKPVLNKAWNPHFYEANSLESWLCVPHDIPGLIELCGGEETFLKRLEYTFDGQHVDPGNEPSFMSTCLYNWVGRPDRTYDRVRVFMDMFFNGPCGIPGNDDSGAMSSWLAFHILGIYPNTGQPWYYLHTPSVRFFTIHLANGKDLKVKARGLSAKRKYIRSARLNGKDYPYCAISHEALMDGGTLVYRMGRKPGRWGSKMFAE